MIHQDKGAGKCWKPVWATLIYPNQLKVLYKPLSPRFTKCILIVRPIFLANTPKSEKAEKNAQNSVLQTIICKSPLAAMVGPHS